MNRSYIFLANELLNYEAELGYEAAQIVLHNLSTQFDRLDLHSCGRLLSGSYFINRAFRNFSKAQYSDVVQNVYTAVRFDHNYLKNRGVLAVFFQITFIFSSKVSVNIGAFYFLVM